MKIAISIAAIALFFLHQDVWLWDDRRLLFGFLPSGLGYHAGYSIVASILWALTVVYAWPEGLDDAVSTDENPAEKGNAP